MPARLLMLAFQQIPECFSELLNFGSEVLSHLAVFVYLATFNTVNHQILLQKMRNRGFEGHF